MKNTEFVEKLYKEQNTSIVKIVKYFTGLYKISYSECEDICQNIYMNLLNNKFDLGDRYINEDNTINMYVIFIIIKNYIYKYKYKKNLIYYINMEYDDNHNNIIDDNMDESVDKLQIIYDEIQKIEYWFDRNLLEIYIEDKLNGGNIRELSRKTKISFYTIQKIVSEFKIALKSKTF